MPGEEKVIAYLNFQAEDVNRKSTFVNQIFHLHKGQIEAARVLRLGPLILALTFQNLFQIINLWLIFVEILEVTWHVQWIWFYDRETTSKKFLWKVVI